MTATVPELLRRRVRTAGAAPLLTWYDLDRGERTELSATSFGNWADKTANLLVNELDAEPGEVVELAIARRRPAHWVTLAWVAACWRVGVLPSTAETAAPAAAVVGADDNWFSWPHVPVLVCSLHPLGLPLPHRPIPPVLDYHLEVRAQPDVFAGPDPAPDAPAWADQERQVDHAGLLAATGAGTGAGRRLVVPGDPWTAVTSLVSALADGGSLVVVAGAADARRLAAIAEQERAVLG